MQVHSFNHSHMRAYHPSLIAPICCCTLLHMSIYVLLIGCPQMSAEHCIIGTFADNLMCIPVVDVISNNQDASLAVKSTVTFMKNDEYMQGRVLFLGGMLISLQHPRRCSFVLCACVKFLSPLIYWFIYFKYSSAVKNACIQEINSILSDMPKRKFNLSTWLARRALSSLRKATPASSRASMMIGLAKDRHQQVTTTAATTSTPITSRASVSGMCPVINNVCQFSPVVTP